MAQDHPAEQRYPMTIGQRRQEIIIMKNELYIDSVKRNRLQAEITRLQRSRPMNQPLLTAKQKEIRDLMTSMLFKQQRLTEAENQLKKLA